MFRSSLIKFLNKWGFIQFLFVIFPVIVAVVYGYAYMTDMLGVARNLEYNNSLSEQAWGSDELKTISHIETDEDDVTHAVIDGEVLSEETVKVDDVIFYVQMYSPDWYQVVTASFKSTYMSQCDLFDAELIDDDIIRVTHEDFSHDFAPGDLICSLSVSPEGLWRVTFLLEDMPHYDLENYHMLELLSSEGGSYTVQVTANYELTVGGFEIDFCSNLPSDSMYYNESNGSFVRNVSKDYAMTFMLRANLIMVILSVILYCLLLWKASQDKQLNMLQSPYLLRVDMFAACLTVLFAPLTLILL